MKVIENVKNNAPSILSVVGIVGLVGTTVSAIKETRKIDDLIVEYESAKDRDCAGFEKAWLLTKGYKYTILIGTTTTACILGANILNKQRMDQLSGAYVCVVNTLHKYRNRVEEIYGKEIDKEIMEHVTTRYVVDESTGMKYELESKELFYDSHNDHYFEATLEDIDRAKYELNKKYAINGSVNMNDFYAELGLPRVNDGHLLGWCDAIDKELYGYSWIDISVEYEPLPLGGVASYLEDDDITDVPKGAYVLYFEKSPTTDYMYD